MNSETLVMPFFSRDCTRCGYCCTVYPCEVGKHLGGNKTGTCKFLELGEDKAVCLIMLWKPEWALQMGQGMGCCLSAKLLNSQTGFVYEFCNLHPDDKRKLAVQRFKKQATQGTAGTQPGQPPEQQGERTYSSLLTRIGQ